MYVTQPWTMGARGDFRDLIGKSGYSTVGRHLPAGRVCRDMHHAAELAEVEFVLPQIAAYFMVCGEVRL